MRSRTRWFSAAASVAAMATLLSGQLPAVDWAKVNAEAVGKLIEYIRLDTSNPPGNETRTMEWLGRVFKAEGIPYQTAESAPGRGNIVARLNAQVPEGKKEPALVLLSHMDVVPVTREYWTAEPFAAIERDGYLWGRGTLDMKGQGIAQLMAFLLLHRNKTPLRRDVIFLATADEEAGGLAGAGWVVQNRPQWLAGAKFLITEGARSRADDSGKLLYFGMGATEKTPGWLKLTAKGRSGHGSVPIPDSAVNRLIAALERLRTYQPPIEVTAEIARALASLAPFEPEPWRTRLANIREYVTQPGAREELAKKPGWLALLTNTISITGLEGTKKVNVIPPVASAQVDCRLLPGWTIERWVAEVKRIIQDDGIQVDVILNFPPAASPPDTPLATAIRHAVEKLHPTVGVAETVSAGFTDSHFFREKGIVSYGFAPFAVSDADSARVHGNDERIPLATFRDGVRLTWQVVYDFSRAE